MATISFVDAKEASDIDDSAAKVLDVGDTRIMWGSANVTNSTNVNFPASFADTSYAVGVTPLYANSFMNNDENSCTAFIRSKATGGFVADGRRKDAQSIFPNIENATVSLQWFAIGPKP